MIEFENLTLDSLETAHICCAISDNKHPGVQQKKQWLKSRMPEGLVFRKATVRGKVFIEYLPAESAFVPIDAPGYLYINCLWISGKYKKSGIGKELLTHCMKDAKSTNGIAILSSKRKMPFLADKKFLMHHGFEVADTASPYFELLVWRNNNAPLPAFTPQTQTGRCDWSDGLVLYYTHQCPFVDHYGLKVLAETAIQHQIPFTAIHLDSVEKARKAPSPFTTYSIFYNGHFITHELLSEKKCVQLMQDINHGKFSH